MNKKISVGAAIMLMAMTAAVAITITIAVLMHMLNSSITDFSKRMSMFQKLSAVDEKVRDYYIGKIDQTKLEDSVIAAYVKGTGDKYGTYLNAESTNQMNLENQGKATGIGVNVIENKDGNIEIVSVTSGSPAQKAGVKPNDLIVKISGQDVKTIGYTNAISMLHGTTGSTAEFTVSRDGSQIPFSVVRNTFVMQTVQSHMIGNIGYVRISEFDGNTDKQFSDQVDSLIKNGAKGLVFDVRNNPGGLVDSVEKMLDKLLPAGPIMRAKYKDGKMRVLKTSDSKQVNLPMAVITNQQTASAAELFTAALKDYGKAKAVGTKTYGKGTMQQIYKLNDGTALDLSVAYFYPPKSDNFEGKGVQPDISVTLSQEKLLNFYNLSESDDDQLQVALNYVKSIAK